MIIDPDKLTGNRLALVMSALAEVTEHIETIEESNAVATDRAEEAEDRADAREIVAQELEQFFVVIEALHSFCERIAE